MENISISDTELLKYAIENGMLDTALVQEKIEMQKREELLKKHPYSIYLGNDGKWYTYLPDEKKGRIFRRRNSEEEIKTLVIEYWKEKEDNPTVDEVYREWLSGKLDRCEISKATRDRYNRQFEQCFSDFKNRKVKYIEEYDVEEFILNAIHQYNLTQKGFSNFRTLIFGIFKYAKKRKYISFSITELVNDIEISRKSFRKVSYEKHQQVFMDDELPKVLKYLEENQDIVNLGILLLFKSGLRIGELAALKHCDITDNVIHVMRTEICYEEDGNRIFEVRDFPKTEAGVRDVIIPQQYCWILKKLRRRNPFGGEYLFEESGDRIRTYVFRNRLNTICKKTGVVCKSPHKIRKTYGTILIDEGVPDSVVISQMGHTDIKTTKQSYYRDRNGEKKKEDVINHVEGLA